MQAFGVPGLAIGIVAGDRLVYAKGFGVRSKAGGAPVDARTVFQIGSTTKAFLAATQGIMVDRGKFRWDDRVVDLYPEFQLRDPWVTREFRVFDLLAQRSGLPPYVNDALGFIGLDEAAMVRSLRYVEPVSSFRTTFAYTNITHVLAGCIVAKAAGAPDWNTVLRQELLDPLGMKDSSYTAAAIAAAPNHAEGYRWTPNGMIELPFTQVFPYDYGGAGDINSNVEDMAHWVRLQLGNGSFEGTAHRLGRKHGRGAHAEGRGERQGLLCAGLDRPADAERQHRLAQRRHQRVRLLCRAAARQRCRRRHSRQCRRLSGRDRGLDHGSLLGNPQVDHAANLLKAATAQIRGGGEDVRQARAPAAVPTAGAARRPFRQSGHRQGCR